MDETCPHWGMYLIHLFQTTYSSVNLTQKHSYTYSEECLGTHGQVDTKN